MVLSSLSMNATETILGITTQIVMRYEENVQQIYNKEAGCLFRERGRDGRNASLLPKKFKNCRLENYSMGFEKMPHVYADQYESYKEFLPSKNLTQFKKNISPIERNNGRQRH